MREARQIFESFNPSIAEQKDEFGNYKDSDVHNLWVGFKNWMQAKVTTHGDNMRRGKKLETIVKLFAKNMFYGDWEWETPNERVITMLMQEVGMYPFKDEDDLIRKTFVSDELYQKAIKEIPISKSKGTER